MRATPLSPSTRPSRRRCLHRHNLEIFSPVAAPKSSPRFTMDRSDNDVASDDDKDEDFNIKDYRDDLDSDESFEDYDENENENAERNDEESDEEREYTGPILSGVHRFDRKLVCIKYPGVVENAEKALDTLGGIATISSTLKTQNRRLELRFRPNNGYCKPTCGDRHQTAGFLLRVRVKKSRARRMEEEAEREARSADFLGPFEGRKLDELLGSLGKKVQSSDSETKRNNCGTSEDVERLADSVRDSCTVEEQPENGNNFGNKEMTLVPEIQERKIQFNDKSSPNSEGNAENGAESRGEDLSRDENYEVPSVKVIGRVDTEFKFESLCDFQYLPIERSPSDPRTVECIYDSVFPAEIPPYRWLKNKVPYFLPPPAFSRMDSVQQYSLKIESDKGPMNVIGKTRKRRAGFSNFIHFANPETPTEPPPGIDTARKIKFLQHSHLERMRKVFEERPIWSKNALICVTNFTGEQLKFLLPSVAYYFMTGPWRIMWIKLGYDPRKDPQARKYQTLDYRLKAMHGLESTVKCKRTQGEHTLPYKSSQGMRPRTTILTSMTDDCEDPKIEKRVSENSYIYREGIVPPSRQMFYQYCDVQVDEIQEMLAKLPAHLPGVKCHEKRGWLPIGFSDQCREIINRQVRAVLRKQMNIPEDHPIALPPKRRIRKNLRLGKMTTEDLKMRRSSNLNRRKKRKEPEDSDSDWTTIDAEQKKQKKPT